MISILIHTVFALNIVAMNTMEFQDYKKERAEEMQEELLVKIKEEYKQ